MVKQVIDLGAAPNDGTGDPLRTGGTKINANFNDVYGHREYHVDDYATLQAAINACATAGGGNVFVPRNFLESLLVPLVAKDDVTVRGANRRESTLQTHPTDFVGDSMVVAELRGDNSPGSFVRNFHMLDMGLIISAQTTNATLSTTLSGAAETAVVVSAIPTNAPAEGVIYITLDSGVIRRQRYTSYTGSTYTIPSSDYTDPADATAGVDVMVPVTCIDATGMRMCSFERMYVEGRDEDTTEHVAIRIADVDPVGTSAKTSFFNVFYDIVTEGGGFRSWIQGEQEAGNANHNYFFCHNGSCYHMFDFINTSVVAFSCTDGYFAGGDGTNLIFRNNNKPGDLITFGWTAEPTHFSDGLDWGNYLINGSYSLRIYKGQIIADQDDFKFGAGMGNLSGSAAAQMHLCNRDSLLMRLQRGSGGQEYHEWHIENATDPDLLCQSNEGTSPTVSLKLGYDGGIHMPNMKGGTTQGGAGAIAGELWYDTDDGNAVKMGV